jgi:pimeloyl-ACP methyl ester carboxylesterase
MSCTIVLVHGAFAESASWERVIDPLVAEGHSVVAAANPLRGLASDAESVSDLVRSVEGPVVLVGHSYGGSVISNVDSDAGEIAGLVYANGFAPAPGEHCFQLASMFPGSMLGPESARPVPRSDGTTDLYVAPDGFHDIFCQDVAAPQAALMARTQRPATQEALTEPSGERPLWKDVPSWFLIGEEDRIIPVERHMAVRARATRQSCSSPRRRRSSRRPPRRRPGLPDKVGTSHSWGLGARTNPGAKSPHIYARVRTAPTSTAERTGDPSGLG